MTAEEAEFSSCFNILSIKHQTDYSSRTIRRIFLINPRDKEFSKDSPQSNIF